MLSTSVGETVVILPPLRKIRAVSCCRHQAKLLVVEMSMVADVARFLISVLFLGRDAYRRREPRMSLGKARVGLHSTLNAMRQV